MLGPENPWFVRGNAFSNINSRVVFGPVTCATDVPVPVLCCLEPMCGASPDLVVGCWRPLTYPLVYAAVVVALVSIMTRVLLLARWTDDFRTWLTPVAVPVSIASWISALACVIALNLNMYFARIRLPWPLSNKTARQQDNQRTVGPMSSGPLTHRRHPAWGAFVDYLLYTTCCVALVFGSVTGVFVTSATWIIVDTMIAWAVVLGVLGCLSMFPLISMRSFGTLSFVVLMLVTTLAIKLVVDTEIDPVHIVWTMIASWVMLVTALDDINNVEASANAHQVPNRWLAFRLAASVAGRASSAFV